MKKIICMALILCMCFCAMTGCQSGNTETETTQAESSEPAPVETEAEEPASLTKEDYMSKVFTDPAEQTIEPRWDDFSPQEGSPIKPEPGDTGETWDLTVADLFPADEDCTDDEFFAKWMAVFFHVSRGATAGCIGLPYQDFENCLLWLDPEQTPCILITGYEY